ncbi:hypothetical protein [Pseudoduganella namucuonensis]|uniref:hypothetical protein n=1 Tax=Pseudoduganella namucuonensis TaxID=1035707 RepID=UPI001C435FC8|nr:hypothetical protein [Pseudoduganella namucuonensis]
MKFKTEIPLTIKPARIAFGIISPIFALFFWLVPGVALAQAKNPLIFADVPDAAMIRVG